MRLTAHAFLFIACLALGFLLTAGSTSSPSAPDPTPIPESSALEPTNPPPSANTAEPEASRKVALPPAVDSRFWGVVFDATGNAIEGATVTAIPVPPPPPLDPAPSLEECEDHLERVRLAAAQHTVKTISDANGEFDLGGLIGTSYTVSATLPDGSVTFTERAEPGWYLELGVGRGEPIEVVVDFSGARHQWGGTSLQFRGLSVPGSVEMVTGKRPLETRSSGGYPVLSIAAGGPDEVVLRMEPGVEVRAKIQGKKSTWVRVTPETEHITLAFTLEQGLPKKVPLEIAVQLPPGDARVIVWAGALEIIPGEPALPKERFLQAAAWQRSWGGVSEPTLHVLPRRTYRVGVGLDAPRHSVINGHKRTRPREVDVEGVIFVSEHGARLELAAGSLLDQDAIFVEVRARGAAEPERPHFSVWTTDPEGDRQRESVRKLPTEDGRFALTGLSRRITDILEGSNPGEVVIEVSAQGFATQTVRLDQHSNPEVAVELPAPARLELEFEPNIPPALQSRLGFMRKMEHGWGGVSREWSAGRAVLPRIPSGDEQIRISVGDYVVAEVSVSLLEGELKRVVVSIEEVYPVSFTGLPDGLYRTQIRLASGEQLELTLSSGEEVCWLPRGRHQFSVGGVLTEFTVPSEGPIQVRKP